LAPRLAHQKQKIAVFEREMGLMFLFFGFRGLRGERPFAHGDF